MKPLLFKKLEINRPKEEKDRFLELSEAEFDLVSGGGSKTTCVYTPGAPGNDAPQCDPAPNDRPDCPPPEDPMVSISINP